MGILNYFTFNDIKSSDHSVYIAGEGVFNSPARRGEEIVVPGRNGSLFLDEGAFENINVYYPAFIGTTREDLFRTKLRELRSRLASSGKYERLTDTYHPDEFRLAIYKSGLETEPAHFNRAGRFTINFDCKPQRFLKSGEISQIFTENGTIENPTPFESSPILKVTGNGVVAIGPYRFIVTGNTETITIDTELMEVYLPAGYIYPLTDEEDEQIENEIGIGIEIVDGLVEPANMNSLVEFVESKMPMIPPGEVPIRMSNTITQLEIIPRWWYL